MGVLIPGLDPIVQRGEMEAGTMGEVGVGRGAVRMEQEKRGLVLQFERVEQYVSAGPQRLELVQAQSEGLTMRHPPRVGLQMK